MRLRTIPIALITLLSMSPPLMAQRPLVGFGVGGGAILGTTLFDHLPYLDPANAEIPQVGTIDLNHIGIFDAHIEIYPLPHIALRGHGMWGSGDLRIEMTGGEDDGGVRRGRSDVTISGLDAGISLWPWSANSAGFTPFVTVGFGRVTYDLGTADGVEGFIARGDRRENAFLFGVGADMNVWRSVALRLEVINHRISSPFVAHDFPTGQIPQSAFDQHISNVRLSLDLHLYLPFGRNSGTTD